VVIRKCCHLHQMVKQRFSPGRASFHLSEPLPRAIRTPCARWTKDSTQDLAGLTLANPWWLLEAPYFVKKNIGIQWNPALSTYQERWKT
jgi:hypothetical protein